MRKSLHTAKKSILFLLAVLLSQQASAEGTKQVSPAADKITALTLIPSRGSGSYLGAAEANRFRFFISDPNEYVFCGFSWKTYQSSGTPSNVTMYYRLYNGNGAEVARGALPTSGAGYISDYNTAKNGPNGVDGVTNGYNPTTFQISALGANFGAGEYSMEFYRSGDGGNTMADPDVWSTAPYFDFTIAKKVGSTYTSIPGRVFCRKWGFVAVNTSLQVTAASNASPSLYSYSEDQTVIKIGFNEVFRPIAYDLAVNFYGVKKTGSNWDFVKDRRSINSANSPEIPEGYRLFLSNPDPNTYAIKPITVSPTLANPPVTGCSGTLKINYNMPAPGDARILLDLNGTTGYQDNTSDRIIEIFGASAGPGSVDWDGKDGDGNPVLNTAIIKITAIYERGRFNLPLYDAEINKNGFKVESIAPIASTTIPLYWDDSTLLTNVTGMSDNNQNNYTGKGINNIYLGQASPAHAWNGNGNSAMTIPAPAVNSNETNGVQYDDFGNVRVINTWGWALQASSAVNSVAFGCFPVSGNVYHDANGLTDSKVNQTGAVTTVPANTLYANIISADPFTDNDGVIYNTLTVRGVATVNANGTFSIPNVPNGKYYVVLSTTQGTVGSTTIPAAALPANGAGTGAWVNTGENFGAPTINGNDGTVNGILSTVITVSNAAVTNANFGIQQRPVSTSITTPAQGNPGGSIRVAVPTLPGTDVEDGTYTGGTKIIINTIPDPAKGKLYYDNIPVTVGQNIPNYDPAKLTVDPVDGNTIVKFTYSHVDAGGFTSSTPATATIEFKVIAVSGNIWDDANGNLTKDGAELFVSGNNTSTGTTVAGGGNLYINLINSTGVVIQTTQVAANGSYTFANAPYNTSGLKLQLTSNAGSVDVAQPVSAIYTNWVYLGQSVDASNTASQAGAPIGVINLNTGTSSAVVNQNFAIEKLPTSDDKTVGTQGNPGGNNRVAVPTLTGSDFEDGTYTGVTLTNEIVINTLPTAATGVLYYNGTAVTVGQTINNYDPSKLTVDPVDGNVTVTFTYTHLDAATKPSVAPATVTINFKVITVSGNAWEDKNANIVKDPTELFVSGNNPSTSTTVSTGVALYVNLVNAEGKVIQSVAIAANGTYSLDKVPQATSGLILQLSTVAGVVNGNMPATSKPPFWTSTGESIGSGNTAAQTSGLSIIDLTTGTTNILAQNFGLKQTGFCFVGRVYLEGALMNNGNTKSPDGRPLMRDNLRSSPTTGLNYIPSSDPYEFATPYTDFVSSYVKKAPQNNNSEYQQVTSAAVFNVTGQNAIVDWVFVELRDKNNSSNVLATRSGLLQRDGDIVDVDGTSCLFFKDVPADNYFVSVRHRSHLGTMTKTAQTVAQLTTLVDFTSVATPLYDKGIVAASGSNYTGLATNNDVLSGYRALWGGDFDANRKIKYSAPNDDNNILLGEVLAYPGNTQLASGFDFAYGYFQGDFDMNSKAKFSAPNDDQNSLLGQVLGYQLNVALGTGYDFLIEQLP